MTDSSKFLSLQLREPDPFLFSTGTYTHTHIHVKRNKHPNIAYMESMYNFIGRNSETSKSSEKDSGMALMMASLLVPYEVDRAHTCVFCSDFISGLGSISKTQEIASASNKVGMTYRAFST